MYMPKVQKSIGVEVEDVAMTDSSCSFIENVDVSSPVQRAFVCTVVLALLSCAFTIDFALFLMRPHVVSLPKQRHDRVLYSHRYCVVGAKWVLS